MEPLPSGRPITTAGSSITRHRTHALGARSTITSTGADDEPVASGTILTTSYDSCPARARSSSSSGCGATKTALPCTVTSPSPISAEASGRYGVAEDFHPRHRSSGAPRRRRTRIATRCTSASQAVACSIVSRADRSMPRSWRKSANATAVVPSAARAAGTRRLSCAAVSIAMEASTKARVRLRRLRKGLTTHAGQHTRIPDMIMVGSPR